MSALMILTITMKNVAESSGPTTRGHAGMHDAHEDGLDPRLRTVAILTSTGVDFNIRASHCAA